MKNVTIEKSKILDRIKANRTRHREIFEKAMTGYEEEVTKRLKVALKEVKDNHIPDFYALAQLPVPEDHTKDYDAIIDMLTMDTAQNVEITESDFRQYVRDEWAWKKQFIGSVSNYTDTF